MEFLSGRRLGNDDLFEATRAARKLVEDIMLVKPGGQAIITADGGSDATVVKITAEAVHGVTPVSWRVNR